jgi:hypothetical protein
MSARLSLIAFSRLLLPPRSLRVWLRSRWRILDLLLSLAAWRATRYLYIRDCVRRLSAGTVSWRSLDRRARARARVRGKRKRKIDEEL